MTEDKTICPRCGQKMKKWQTPNTSTWGGNILYVCFNDECPYYVRGWDHIYKTREVRASYRHWYDPATGGSGPLPVNTPEAGKNLIIED